MEDKHTDLQNRTAEHARLDADAPEAGAAQTSTPQIPPREEPEAWPSAPPPAPKVPIVLRNAVRRDLWLAAFLLLWGVLLWDSLLFVNGFGAGEAVGLTGFFLSAALWLLREAKRRTAYGTACGVLCLLGGASLAFSGDLILKVLTFFLLSLLFLLYVIERRNLRSGEGLRARIHDLLTAAFSIALGRLPESVRLLLRGSGGERRQKQTTAILLGLLCAIPVLFILVPLMISSDAAFEGLVNRLDWDSFGKLGIALVFGLCMALIAFSLLFASDCPGNPLPGRGFRGLEPVLVATFLGAVSAAYVLYLAAQFAYFTDAFRGLLPKDFTVAQYARRGFFEMCWITAINLGLIVLSTRLCRKTNGKLPGAVKGLALFLCVFSLILVATALSKMVLYMNALGLTRKRVLTSVFMVFLALVIAAAGLRLFVKRIPVPQFAVILGGTLLILLNLANVDGIVARYNVGAYRGGRLDSLDVHMICELGDGAVPSLTELLDDRDPKIAEAARDELTRRLVRNGLAEWENGTQLHSADQPQDLRAWNLISCRARAALLEHRDRILSDGVRSDTPKSGRAAKRRPAEQKSPAFPEKGPAGDLSTR